MAKTINEIANELREWQHKEEGKAAVLLTLDTSTRENVIAYSGKGADIIACLACCFSKDKDFRYLLRDAMLASLAARKGEEETEDNKED